jgi:hypothetical protein
LLNEQWNKKIININNKINTEFGNYFLSYERFDRDDEIVIFFIKHINKKYIIKLKFLNAGEKNDTVVISVLKMIKNKNTQLHYPKIMDKTEFNIEDKNKIIKKLSSHIKEITLKSMFV